MRLDQQHDHIRIRSPAPRRSDHRAVKPTARLKEARRVDENDLAVAFHRNAANAGAGGLNLVCHDRNLGPDHPVQQGRFACIRLADQGNKTRARCHVLLSNWLSMAFAADCCASRFDPAVASADCPVLSLTAMVKTGAWSGPLRDTSW